ncbi:hypothetical protein A7K50_03250 [Dehalobacter sp. MCB1]|uniref:hypothetical protein n=1 Tax=Dehalobacter sp. MCB1 TaxID=1844756 RepID=UPI000EDF9524|nr:hypothetical protein [Dehalobacter sp. MCB1]RJE47678.1 hypothetical protein A7K50_03250 [Dehalobacter sp. MCB1]
MTISNLTLSYPDFVLGQIINPDEFDQNNDEIVDKINETINAINADVAELVTHKTSTDHDSRYYTETEADAKYATKAEVTSIELGQITDGSLTDVKLSNTAGQIKDRVNILESIAVYESASGTGTVITLSDVVLSDNYPKTFIAGANNVGAATTINGKPLYKPNTTTAPNLVAGKAYTVWYDLSGDCFFVKASAEGDAVAANVLATKTFSNDSDTGIVGTMPNRAGDTAALSSEVSGTTLKLLASDGYRDGVDDKVTVTDSNFLAENIKKNAELFGLSGSYDAYEKNVTISPGAFGTMSFVRSAIACSYTSYGGFLGAISANGKYGLQVSLGLTYLMVLDLVNNTNSLNIALSNYAAVAVMNDGSFFIANSSDKKIYKYNSSGVNIATSSAFTYAVGAMSLSIDEDALYVVFGTSSPMVKLNTNTLATIVTSSGSYTTNRDKFFVDSEYVFMFDTTSGVTKITKINRSTLALVAVSSAITYSYRYALNGNYSQNIIYFSYRDGSNYGYSYGYSYTTLAQCTAVGRSNNINYCIATYPLSNIGAFTIIYNMSNYCVILNGDQSYPIDTGIYIIDAAFNLIGVGLAIISSSSTIYCYKISSLLK